MANKQKWVESIMTVNEGNRSFVAHRILLPLYRRAGSESIRALLRRRIMRLEGGPATSLTIREILVELYDLEVGLHSSWPHDRKPRVFQRGTRVGRYAFVANTVRTYTRNHPMDTKSTHGLFYNPGLGKVKGDPVEFGNLMIGHGAVVEHNAIILPPTESIGEGALITAGSVVYTNVPPYAVVSGFPARVTGYRFSKEVIDRLIKSRWWEKTPAELTSDTEYLRSLLGESVHDPHRPSTDSSSATGNPDPAVSKISHT